jgi:hypothetical protein
MVLHFLATSFSSTPLPDPANSYNLVSDLLTPEQKYRIAAASQQSLPQFPDIL